MSFGEPALHFTDVVLEPPDHNAFKHLLGSRYASAETLRIEDLQERREAVRVAIVRSCREEQPVLEARSQIADCSRDLRVDGVLLSAGRCGVVGFVEDQERATQERSQPITQGAGVCLVDQQAVGDEEPRVGGPRVDPKAPFQPDSLHVVLVKDLERQPEAALQLILPLEEHRRRATHDDHPDLLPQQ